MFYVIMLFPPSWRLVLSRDQPTLSTCRSGSQLVSNAGADSRFTNWRPKNNSPEVPFHSLLLLLYKIFTRFKPQVHTLASNPTFPWQNPWVILHPDQRRGNFSQKSGWPLLPSESTSKCRSQLSVKQQDGLSLNFHLESNDSFSIWGCIGVVMNLQESNRTSSKSISASSSGSGSSSGVLALRTNKSRGKSQKCSNLFWQICLGSVGLVHSARTHSI